MAKGQKQMKSPPFSDLNETSCTMVNLSRTTQCYGQFYPCHYQTMEYFASKYNRISKYFKKYKTWDTNDFFFNNFGIRKFSIIHCQLRNESSNLKAHILFNDLLSYNTDCPNCSGPLDDNDHILFICPKNNNLRLALVDFMQAK